MYENVMINQNMLTKAWKGTGISSEKKKMCIYFKNVCEWQRTDSLKASVRCFVDVTSTSKRGA